MLIVVLNNEYRWRYVADFLTTEAQVTQECYRWG